MIKTSSKVISEQVLSNGAYKFVALIASIILWLTVLGRKDAVITHEVGVKFETQSSVVLDYDSSLKIRMKILGPRKMLKEYSDSVTNITFDLKERAPGVYSIPVTGKDLNLPMSLKLIALQPEEINIKIMNREKNDKDN
ncbi:MAG: hypothetical protein H6625_09380 [Bdellovibrionaceae bacterium]|nr:hypothetical protein [Pseudobdellovibrionaceae bacterium]